MKQTFIAGPCFSSAFFLLTDEELKFTLKVRSRGYKNEMNKQVYS